MERCTLLLVFVTLAAVPGIAAAECEPREAEGSITVESCPIENADYPLVRAEMTVRGSMSAVIALLADAAACPDWQSMCVEERATPLDAPFQTLRQRVSGKGISRRITMDRAAWWRTADGRVIGDMAGADDMTPEFKGKRVLCVRSRWFLAPGDEEGTIEIVQETVSDPQPPFGLGAGAVTPPHREDAARDVFEPRRPARCRPARRRPGHRVVAASGDGPAGHRRRVRPLSGGAVSRVGHACPGWGRLFNSSASPKRRLPDCLGLTESRQHDRVSRR